MRIADIVSKCECRVHGEERQHEHAAPPVRAQQPYQAERREQHRPPELLNDVEPVHRQALAHHRLRHVHHHRLAPVGLGHVEPERLQRVGQARRRIRPQPEPSQVPEVLQRSNDGDCQRKRDDSRASHRPPTLRSREHEEQRVARQQQDHRQVIAEPKRVRGEKQDEAAIGRPVRSDRDGTPVSVAKPPGCATR